MGDLNISCRIFEHQLYSEWQLFPRALKHFYARLYLSALISHECLLKDKNNNYVQWNLSSIEGIIPKISRCIDLLILFVFEAYTYCISQKAWTLFWKMIFASAFPSHIYGVLGNLVDWQAKISMVVTIFQPSKYESGLWEEKNKSMDVQHIWETQYCYFCFHT
jgi:hypothetical protein